MMESHQHQYPRGRAEEALSQVFPLPIVEAELVAGYFELSAENWMEIPFQLDAGLLLTSSEAYEILESIRAYEPRTGNQSMLQRGLMVAWNTLATVLEAREAFGDGNIPYTNVRLDEDTDLSQYIQQTNRLRLTIRAELDKYKIQTHPVYSAIVDLFAEFGVSGIVPERVAIVCDLRNPEDLLKNAERLSGCGGIFLGLFNLGDPLAFRCSSSDSNDQPDDVIADIAGGAQTTNARISDRMNLQKSTYPDALILAEDGQLLWGVEAQWEKYYPTDRFFSEEICESGNNSFFLSEESQEFKKSLAWLKLRSHLENALKRREGIF